MSDIALTTTSNDAIANLCAEMGIQLDLSSNVAEVRSNTYTSYSLPEGCRKFMNASKAEEFLWNSPDNIEEEIEGFSKIRSIGGIIIGFEGRAELKTKYDPNLEPAQETLCQSVGYTVQEDNQSYAIKKLLPLPLKSMYGYSDSANGGKGGADLLTPLPAVESYGMIGSRADGSILKCADCIRAGKSTTHPINEAGGLEPNSNSCAFSGVLYMVVTELVKIQKKPGPKGSDPTEVKIVKNLMEEQVKTVNGEELGPFLLAIKLTPSLIRGSYTNDIFGYENYLRGLSYLEVSDPCRDPRANFTTITTVQHPKAPSRLLNFERRPATLDEMRVGLTIQSAALHAQPLSSYPRLQVKENFVPEVVSSDDFFETSAESLEDSELESDNPFQ